jgi:hypothetical protein
MKELMDVWKKNRASSTLRPFTYALHCFYKRIMSDFMADAPPAFTPIYTGNVPKSVRMQTDTAFTPSQRSVKSKATISHSQYKAFDTAPASSPHQSNFQKPISNSQIILDRV